MARPREYCLIAVFLSLYVVLAARTVLATDSPPTSMPEEQAPDSDAAVVTVVETFGLRMKLVSLLAPNDVLLSDIRRHYGDLVTRELLEQWLTAPRAAPGRLTSSPWPDRIEVRRVTVSSSSQARVYGHIVWLTSVEMAQGGADSLQPVRLKLVRDDEGPWRIHDICVKSKGG